ncbi:MAG: hypothetical protein V2I33_06025, partial [Kangiellaceae bacterium]|nr:hypothetical protein [Kangiellaceae bacterium]
EAVIHKFNINTKFDRPILFRTCDKTVYESTLETGSIWMRSSHYYQKVEDLARQDKSEGVNGTPMLFPLKFAPENAQGMSMEGEGSVGQEIIPHYITSMHGTGITEKVRKDFGGYTLGVRCIADLAAEILFEASQQLAIHSYRFGQVAYQRTALTQSYSRNGAAIELTGKPSVYIKSINTDVLRKDPIEPFISQDEWRVAVFPTGYLNSDPNEPLKINVNPKHFYRYIEP